MVTSGFSDYKRLFIRCHDHFSFLSDIVVFAFINPAVCYKSCGLQFSTKFNGSDPRLEAAARSYAYDTHP